MLRTEVFEGGFYLYLGDKRIISHSETEPAVFLGTGREHISMYRGNFQIRDSLTERAAMHFTGGSEDRLCFHSEAMGDFCLSLSVENGLLRIKGKNDRANRIWLRFAAAWMFSTCMTASVSMGMGLGLSQQNTCNCALAAASFQPASSQ